MRTHTIWATRMLSCLLRDGDGTALLGDLAEERARRMTRDSRANAARWYRRELYRSLAAVLRLRSIECVRAVPWGIVVAAYVVIGLYEFAAMWLLSRTWPEVAEWTSALRLVLEFPGIIAIAYAAATFRRSAAFILGALMLCVAGLLNIVTTETISTPYIVASLVVGPLGAVLGGLLRRRPIIVASALALLVVTGSASAQEPFRAPQELDAFAFLIGKWEGAGKTRLPDGKVVEYPITWTGHYILDGTAIADDGRGPAPDGGLAVGITFRQYDGIRKTWIIEFLSIVPTSQLFRQVYQGGGSISVQGRNVIVINAPPAGTARRIRENYLVSDNDNWVYRLDESMDGGTSWNEGRTVITLRRSK